MAVVCIDNVVQWAESRETSANLREDTDRQDRDLADSSLGYCG